MVLVGLLGAAAHEGEEFVIALPAVMLAAAFFLMRWANQGGKDDDDTSDAVESAPGPDETEEPAVTGAVVGTRSE